MLLGGKGGCQQCTCVPCGECTRTCQNPHTGSAFEPVYTLYFEGAESGNVGDGYLTASGDSDTSDPYDGMDGNGPWFQQVVGTFTVNSTQTRHPCRVTVSFWRNNFVLGASTIPPPSAALTSQSVKVEVTAGAVIVGDRVIVPADGEVTINTLSIPLVTGSGDQSGNDPRFYEGSISVTPQCESATFSIRARIEWNTQKRQHVLYGLVRECYEIGTPCATSCSGSPPPDTIYLEIKNVSLTGGASMPGLAGTYAMSRLPNYCDLYEHTADLTCPIGQFAGFAEYIYASSTTVISQQMLRRFITIGSQTECVQVGLSWYNATPVPICGTGVIKSGTGGTVTVTNGAATTGTFDWEISA